MLRAYIKRLFRAPHYRNSTDTSFVGSYLPVKHAAQYVLHSATTRFAASQQLSPWLVVRVSVLLKRLITRLAVVLLVTLCPALAANAQVNVDNDLISFARWKSNESDSQFASDTPLYTLNQTGGIPCVPFKIGQTTKTLSLETQLNSRNCQIGEGTGTGNKADWDQMLIPRYTSCTMVSKSSCSGSVQYNFSLALRGTLYVNPRSMHSLME